MNASVITPCDLTALTNEVIGADGLLKIKPYSFYKGVNENELKFFLHQNAIYVLPTTELIDWLKENIIGTAIEIGAGHGAIGRALNIPTTDSRMQERPEIKFIYESSGQPVIKYNNDIEKLDAIQALDKHKPDTVIGAFITHKYDERIGNGNAFGVQEELILQRTKRYINICNKVTHKDKPILKVKHKEYKFDWLITRAVNQNENAIIMFDEL
jgi:hypothetical protein